jgi:homoserine kinase
LVVRALPGEPYLSGPVRRRPGLRLCVTAPASSANLGAGFDTLALALDLRLVLWVHDGTAPPAGAPSPWGDPGLLHLAERAAQAVFQAVGRRPDVPYTFLLESPIPAGRGLGSSAAAQAAGLVAANRLLGLPLSPEELLDLLASLEGHGDNAAAALLGGLTWTWREGQHFRALRLAPPPLEVALATPRRGLATSRSRQGLPSHVPLPDAVHNLQRAGLWLVAAHEGRWDLLWAAADDRLHQPARGRLMPYLEDAVAAAREAGARFAALSGSGTTVMALCPPGQGLAVAQAMAQAMARRGTLAHAWRVRPTERGTQSFPPAAPDPPLRPWRAKARGLPRAPEGAP